MDQTRPERRRERRLRSLLGGHVVMNNRFSTMDCLVRDLTPHGARLRFGGASLLPAEFELRIDGRDDRRKAHQIWAHEGDMGVAFD